MEWAFEMLENDDEYFVLLFNIAKELREFFQKDKTYIKSKLRDKLIKGAEEHGAPIYLPEVVDHEIECEKIDLIGWTLVKQYNQKRIKEHQ